MVEEEEELTPLLRSTRCLYDVCPDNGVVVSRILPLRRAGAFAATTFLTACSASTRRRRGGDARGVGRAV